MEIKNALKLLEKEMDRQQFIKLMGLAVLGIVGLPQLLSLLHHSPEINSSSVSMGYGSSPYGH